MYRPKFKPQLGDPTGSLDGSNCTMASGAMALDFHTEGKIDVMPGTLRKHQDDQTGGTDIGDVQTAWMRGYQQVLTDRRGKDWNQLIVDLKNGHGVVLQGDYDVLTGADTCLGSFNGDHAIYLNPEFFDGSTTIAVGDPLCKSFKRIKVSVLKAYAEKLGTRVYGKKGPILFGITKAHTPTAPKPPVTAPPTQGEEMIVGESTVRTSNRFLRLKSGTAVYKDPACTMRLTAMVGDADVDFMGTVPGNTVAWAVEIATGRIEAGKTLPVIAYVKRADTGEPTLRPVEPDLTIYTQAQLDAAVAAAVTATKAKAKAVQTLEVTFE